MSFTAAQNLQSILLDRPMTHTQLARLILRDTPGRSLEATRVRISGLFSAHSPPPAISVMWGRIALALKIPLSDLDPDTDWQIFNHQLSPQKYKDTFPL